jgi:D-alanine-D-alanine ligase-like ATP-grasp enzyme
MNPNNRKNVFELFGFDFLLDEEFRLWLLEINTNPFLGTPSKAMKILVP